MEIWMTILASVLGGGGFGSYLTYLLNRGKDAVNHYQGLVDRMAAQSIERDKKIAAMQLELDALCQEHRCCCNDRAREKAINKMLRAEVKRLRLGALKARQENDDGTESASG